MKGFLKYLFAIGIVLSACTPEDKPESPENDDEYIIERSFFAKGADISWATQMEKDGVRFYNHQGQDRECTTLMKEIGMNSIRLRVWVNPKDGWCGKEDVLIKAKRAKALGMNIMINFHYSDTWADPGNQNPPAAWSRLYPVPLKEALVNHTKDVLNTLKENNIDVKWVQVGNEVNSGILHPIGQVMGSATGEFHTLFNAGYWAVKEVFPEAKVILHLSEGFNKNMYSWFLGTIHGVKYDMIGLSIYPSWWVSAAYVDGEIVPSHWSDWEERARSCVENMRTIVNTYKKPVMICETGMPATEPGMAKEAMQYLLAEAAALKECHGVFYWEPQVYGGWKPADYEALGWNSYDMGAFYDGKPTIALDPFKENIQ